MGFRKIRLNAKRRPPLRHGLRKPAITHQGDAIVIRNQG